VTFTLITPFLVYFAADKLGASGVLAAAAAGMILGQKGGGMYTPEARILGRGVWNTIFFTFNGALFIILGLQLRSIFAELAIFPALTLLNYALSIAATVVVVRRSLLDERTAAREGGLPSKAFSFVLAWCGMRGVVSLAAALSIPNYVMAGAPFPARDLILFITFVVILVTLIGQGLSLPWIIRRFRVVEDDDADISSAAARVRLSEAGLARLVQLEVGFESTMQWEVAGRLRSKYEETAVHARAHIEGVAVDADRAQHDLERQIIRETIKAERDALNDLRHAGEINEETFRRMQYDIDLAESRLLTT
jgi:NhaP-type Na+/H+ or K+/H+ antiporter